jgi:hypothetical protein
MVVHTKYPFFDDGKGLKANPNVSLSLNWNIIPNAGILPRVQSGKTYFKFPNSYAWDLRPYRTPSCGTHTLYSLLTTSLVVLVSSWRTIVSECCTIAIHVTEKLPTLTLIWSAVIQ